MGTFASDKQKLTEFLKNVEQAKLQLPDFQRGWVWDDERIKSLLASVSREFPIGAVMMLEAGGDARFKSKPIEKRGMGQARFDFIQFLLDENEQWNFNYLLTRDGKVIGSKMSYDRQAVLLREMEAKAKEKLKYSPNKANTADAKGRAAD